MRFKIQTSDLNDRLVQESFGLGVLRLVQIFAWLIVNGKANTKVLLRRKGMRHLDSKCIFCHVYDVTTRHLVFSCVFAMHG